MNPHLSLIMKAIQFLLLALSLCFSHGVYSQCSNLSMNYEPGCSGESHQLIVNYDVSCGNAASVYLEANIDGQISGQFGDGVVSEVLFLLDPNDDGTGPANACVTIMVYDAENNIIDNVSECINDFWIEPEAIVFGLGTYTQSCDQFCCSLYANFWQQYSFTTDWGNGDLTTGEGLGYSFQNYCYTVSGNYEINITDQNGCITALSVSVPQFDLQENISCASALELENMVSVSTEPCQWVNDLDMCGNTVDGIVSWYHINSGDMTHMTVGSMAYTDFYHMKVFEWDGTGDCTSAIEIGCEENLYGSHCFDMPVQIDTDYYIQYIGNYISESPVQVVVNLGTEAMTNLCGCNDPDGCNYDPEALITDYSDCGNPGCNNPSACNYNQSATCDNGSCVYGTNMNLQLFHDLNGDGIMQTGVYGESTLSVVGYVTILETNTIAYADAGGQIVIPDLPNGNYTLIFTDENGIWLASTGDQLTITLPSCDGLDIGLTSIAEQTLFSAYGTIWPSTNIHCQNGFYPGLIVQNTGNVALNGMITISFDEVLIPEQISFGVNYDAYANGVITWQIENQAPGSVLSYITHIVGPGEDFVGESFDFTINLQLVDENDLVIYSNTWNSSPVVSCAYDPNDKQANPVGYEEQHFILEENEIQYTIQFQNTGNAMADVVVIEDQLDLEHLDLASFHPIAASHSYTTLIDADGLVRFVFDNINLPDSAMDEPNSHGFVIYGIAPRSDVQGWDQIHNTAYIYFDENAAVITNTTQHTIYDCNWLSQLPDYDNICIGNYTTLDFGVPFVENYSWTLDGNPLSETTPTIMLEFLEAGEYLLGLTRSNSLCSGTAEIAVIVHDIPEVTLEYDDLTGTITGPLGYQYAWYINEQLVLDDTDNSIIPWDYAADGLDCYAVVYDEIGCSASSNTITLVGVSEYAKDKILLFPNPMDDRSVLTLPPGKWNVQLTDATGRIIQNWISVSNQLVIYPEGLMPGSYHISAVNEENERKTTKLMVR
jgi:hypothetical protein